MSRAGSSSCGKRKCSAVRTDLVEERSAGGSEGMGLGRGEEGRWWMERRAARWVRVEVRRALGGGGGVDVVVGMGVVVSRV